MNSLIPVYQCEVSSTMGNSLKFGVRKMKSFNDFNKQCYVLHYRSWTFYHKITPIKWIRMDAEKWVYSLNYKTNSIFLDDTVTFW